MRFFLFFLLIFTQAFAAPAYNKTREFTQSDGTLFEAKAYGNQHLNWIETTDGEILKYNQKNKNFEYAIIENRQLRSSGVRYEKEDSSKIRSFSNIDKLNKEELYKLWGEKQDESNRNMRHSH